MGEDSSLEQKTGEEREKMEKIRLVKEKGRSGIEKQRRLPIRVNFVDTCGIFYSNSILLRYF